MVVDESAFVLSKQTKGVGGSGGGGMTLTAPPVRSTATLRSTRGPHGVTPQRSKDGMADGGNPCKNPIGLPCVGV